MGRKYQVTLPGPASEQLEQLATSSELRPATLAGQFVRNELVRAAAEGKVRALRALPPASGVASGAGRARWLEPYGGDADWRAAMWGQIVALHGRYPKALAWLQEGWWDDEELTEVLCALATWRGELDDSGTDTREELAYHLQLRELTQLLREGGGGVTNAWSPGPSPAAWHE